jgi:ABC-type multidrug transport system permease subunit
VTTHEVIGRPSTLALIWGQFRYSTRSFWRTPVAAFFTLVFPTTFLVVISAIAGNAVVDDRSGIRLAQFLAPVFAVFGICMASFVSLALGVAYAREAGVLKRLRGTPLPSWAHLAGRILTAMFVSLIALLLVVGIGVVFYDVDIVWRTLPAVLLTVIVGVFCFAALGLAAVSIAPTPGATQALTNGGLILLAFISDIFIVQLPDWLDQVGWAFPLKHFVNAVADGFNPYLAGSGLYWDHLAVMLAWGVGGVLVALRLFTWEPRPASRRHRRGSRTKAREGAASEDPAVNATLEVADLTPARNADSPTRLDLVRGQVRYSTTAVLRDPMSVFFAVAFPVILLVFFSAIYGDEVSWGGMPLPQYLAAAFSVYGVAVMAYVTLAGGVVDDRSRYVLKRLRGTPVPPWAYLAGRIGAALVVGLMTVALVFGIGAVFFGVRVGALPLLLSVLVYVVIIGCAASLGMLLASLVDSPQSAIALALATLLPLSMFSDIFVNAPDLPPVLSAIGWAFPLRHMAWLAAQTTYGAGIGAEWLLHLGVIAAWGVVAALLAWRLFRWEPRHSQ